MKVQLACVTPPYLERRVLCVADIASKQTSHSFSPCGLSLPPMRPYTNRLTTLAPTQQVLTVTNDGERRAE